MLWIDSVAQSVTHLLYCMSDQGVIKQINLLPLFQKTYFPYRDIKGEHCIIW